MQESTGEMPVLRARGLTKKVSSPEGQLTILDRADLEVARGETLAILGPSGAGKSSCPCWPALISRRRGRSGSTGVS